MIVKRHRRRFEWPRGDRLTRAVAVALGAGAVLSQVVFGGLAAVV